MFVSDSRSTINSDLNVHNELCLLYMYIKTQITVESNVHAEQAARLPKKGVYMQKGHLGNGQTIFDLLFNNRTLLKCDHDLTGCQLQGHCLLIT